MDNKGDMEMQATKGTDKGVSPENSVEDQPPKPPDRDRQDASMVSGPDTKRRKVGSFPRPEIIYKPENTETCMTCLKYTLILFNLLIWLLGAALTGLGIWIKVDREFWDIQTGLDMKQFATAGYVMIAAGVFIMIIGFIGCYGAMAQKIWMLFLYAAILVVIVLLEIAVMAIVWTASNNKDMKEEMKRRAKKAMQQMNEVESQRYFIDLLQSKLQCCGVDGPDDYEDTLIPPSCTDPSTGYPNEQGCLDSIVKYLKNKASILGGTAIAIFILQLAAFVFTVCLACGLKQAAANGIF